VRRGSCSDRHAPSYGPSRLPPAAARPILRTMAWVRRAAAADVPALARLHVAAWRLAYQGILPQHVLAGLSAAEFERIWGGLLHDGNRTTLVACPEGGDPAGFVAFRLEPEAEIIGLYVDPAYWRRGMGRLLMGAALERLAAAGAGRVLLWVMRDNARARAFYAACGFSPTGGRRDSERHGSRFEELEYAGAAAPPAGG
jgi:ribosomal protein S18 acetylase RimI-like enzyme